MQESARAERFGGRPAAAKRSYTLPGLDGLRALAVVLVLIYHLMPAWMPTGMIGVDAFFVISGFLITSLLLKEGQNNGYLSLPRFWVRRIRRLLPAILLLVLVTVPAALAVGGDALAGMDRQVFGALSFTSNWTNIAAGNEYFTQSSPELFTHLWSLAVEEQFYLLWPVVLAVMLTLLPGIRRTRWVAVGLAVASAAAMLVLIQTGSSPSRVYYGTDTHAFGLMAGAALALARPWVLQGAQSNNALQRRGARRLSRHVLGPAAVVALVWLSLSSVGEQPLWLHPWGLVGASLLTLVALIAVVDDARRGSRGPFVRLLEVPLVVWIGQRSYGIYLWHWPVYVLFVHAAPTLDPLVRAGLVVVLSVAAAAASHRFVEQPVRRNGFGACTEMLWRRMVGRAGAQRAHFARAASAAVLVGALATGAAVAVAPQQTAAQDYVAAGEQALEEADETDATERSESPESPEPPEQTEDGTVEEPDGTRDETDDTPDEEDDEDEVDAADDAADGDSDAGGEAVSGGSITYIGDSVGVAASPPLLEQLDGIDIHAATSRFIGDGVDIAAQLEGEGRLRDVVVVSLATNGPVTEEELDDLLETAGREREVYLVNAHGLSVDWVPENNRILADAAEEHDHVHLVDWDAAISERPDLLAGDGIHPGPTGAELYVETLESALESTPESAPEG
ncbi:MAG: acyltransferase family protein [Nesterenkonia sp.]|nr:acyltransferase family protein [Nesterenkonia sp.]